MPLFPIATGIWGVIPTALLSLLGWLSGAMVAFLLARKYGIPLVKKIFPLREIERYQKHIPQENLLLGLIFLRIALNFDIINYLLGLFKHIKTRTFFGSILVVFTLYSFAFAYIGSLPWQWQIISFVIGSLVVLTSWQIYKKRNSKSNKKPKSI
ncbi:MAG: VTT domain-containing protein [Candidatus Pacearchaeota archaeon]